MAQDNQLEFPARQPTQTDVRRDNDPDLTQREDKKELFAAIATHAKALEDLFDEEKYSVDEKSFLHKKSHLYQWQSSDLVVYRAEKRARAKIIDRELAGEANARRRKELIDEKSGLLAELEDLTRAVDEGKSHKLADEKKNRLRTNWVNFVMGRTQLIVEDFGTKRLGVDCGFGALADEMKILQTKYKELLRQEARLKSVLEDSSDIDEPRVKMRVAVMAAELQDVYQMKKEFVTTELERFKNRCLQRLRDLRRRLLGEKLEV